MFSPITPILSATTPDEAAGFVLERVAAIQTVLAAMARIAGARSVPDLHALSSHADLSAALGDMNNRQIAQINRELDAIAAALHAGFVAIENARKRGHAAQAAARMLHAECREAFANTLAAAEAHGLSA